MRSLRYHVVRGFLALAFLIYGIAKLADIQFNRAYQPYAFENVSSELLSGFQLTWRFFAYSRVYQCAIGFAELGQGNSTALPQIAAEELDLDLTQIKIVGLDTTITPNQGGTYSSASIARGP